MWVVCICACTYVYMCVCACAYVYVCVLGWMLACFVIMIPGLEIQEELSKFMSWISPPFKKQNETVPWNPWAEPVSWWLKPMSTATPGS